MTLVIRPLESSDAPAWSAMRRAMGPDWLVEDFDRLVNEFLTTGRIQTLPHAVFLALLDEHPIGFAEFSLREYAEGCLTSPVTYLEGWYVEPRARGRGVGAALVRAGEQWGIERGCSELASDAEIENELSIRAHKALGFEEVGRAVCFRKSIAASPGGRA